MNLTNRTTRLIVAGMLFQFSVHSASAEKMKVGFEQGKTEFLATGNPGFLKINGHGSGPSASIFVEDSMASGEIEVDLNSLDTGMALRNRHMKEKYLHVDQFPKAKLTFANLQLPKSWSHHSPALNLKQVDGLLHLHGVKRPIKIDIEITNKAELSARFEIKLTDFEVEIPSFMGVTVADLVAVKTAAKLRLVE